MEASDQIGESQDDEDLRTAAVALMERIVKTLRATLDIIIHPGQESHVICPRVILDAVRSTREAYQDTRNSYPHAITVIKCHAIQAFWIAKLKPIRTNRLQKADGLYSIISVNESIALAFLLDAVSNGIRAGEMREFFGGREPNAEYMDRFIKEYRESPAFYNKDNSPVEGSQLLHETTHHMRYKNLTSVSLYEMMMHALIAARVHHTEDPA